MREPSTIVVGAGVFGAAAALELRRRGHAVSLLDPGPLPNPRGATALLRSARAWAWLTGRDFVTPDDVKALAHATLVHRLGLRPEAELEGVDVAQVLGSALGSVPVPR